MSWYLLSGAVLMLVVFLLVQMWLHDDRRRDEDRQQLLDRHRELAGEGDECPWSVRLTAADKREAIHKARVELGLEEDPVYAEHLPVGWVKMIHPTSLGEPPARVTREAYENVYRKKGWIKIQGGQPHGLPRIANFNAPSSVEITNLGDTRRTWLGGSSSAT